MQCIKSATNFKDFNTQRNFRNISKQNIKAQRNFRNCGNCAFASNCALPNYANPRACMTVSDVFLMTLNTAL